MGLRREQERWVRAARTHKDDRMNGAANGGAAIQISQFNMEVWHEELSAAHNIAARKRNTKGIRVDENTCAAAHT